MFLALSLSDVVLIMLIKVKMLIIVGILTFMSRINFVLSKMTIMRGSRKFCQRGSNSDNVFFFFFFFFFEAGREDPKLALQAGHHRPTSETPCKWRITGGLMMALH